MEEHIGETAIAGIEAGVVLEVEVAEGGDEVEVEDNEKGKVVTV